MLKSLDHKIKERGNIKEGEETGNKEKENVI